MGALLDRFCIGQLSCSSSLVLFLVNYQQLVLFSKRVVGCIVVSKNIPFYGILHAKATRSE